MSNLDGFGAVFASGMKTFIGVILALVAIILIMGIIMMAGFK